MEVELKLLLAPADNEALMRHPLIAAHASGPARAQPMTARYFDTPDLHFLHHGAGLRVRKVGEEWIQTMKAGGSVQSGLHSRNEWECPVDRAWPRLGRLRKLIGNDPQWRDMLDLPDLKERLEPLFLVEVERHTWDLEIEGNSIELVLDQGHIERHGRKIDINEIELELKEGEPAALYAFALELHKQIPLRLSNISKAERGYLLCRQTGTAPYRAQALSLDPDNTVGEALKTILDNCLQHIQRNEEAVIHGDDPETLHQMRVGLRRLRSALKLFDTAAPCPEALAADIAWLGTELGAARDADVLLMSTLPRIQSNPGGKNGLLELQALALAAARGYRKTAAKALLSPRYTQLLLSMGVWMQHIATDVPDSPLPKFVHSTMQRLHKQLIKRANRMDDDDADSIHRTRIAAKRARYALEFFHSLYRQKGSRQYLKTLAAIQSELGQHNDLIIADRLLQEMAEQHPDAADTIGYARGYLQALQSQKPVDLDQIRDTLHHLKLPH
ncbi:CYTH and CHAD domain-containing protein [Oxalobacteraceae bacterium OTU3REALA1]|nr:CYTH and CHAD domain-containing protein [Oxalobacteraceae bacterium OTU3REALA1]